MARFNNVDLLALERVTSEAQVDPSRLQRMQQLEGEWLLDETGPQFRATVNFEAGSLALESDQPTRQGGAGTRPNPMTYCLYGLASCYASMFALVASLAGVRLRSLGARLEMPMNYLRAYGLGAEPPVESVKVTLLVDTDATDEVLHQFEREAQKRCPAVYCLTNAIKLDAALERR